MGHFFEDSMRESQKVAKVFAGLKNDQSVSRKITEEKLQRLAQSSQLQVSTQSSPGIQRPPDEDFDMFLEERRTSVEARSGASDATAGPDAANCPAPVAARKSDDLWKELFE
jgi:hypothetical protein